MTVYRGEIYYIFKGEATGTEQMAGLPAIVVSNNIGNEHSNCIEVVFLTTKEKKPMPTHVKIACDVPSTALCEQIASVSKDRLGNYIRTCTDEEMKEIDKALLVSLGIAEKEESTVECESQNKPFTVPVPAESVVDLLKLETERNL